MRRASRCDYHWHGERKPQICLELDAPAHSASLVMGETPAAHNLAQMTRERKAKPLVVHYAANSSHTWHAPAPVLTVTRHGQRMDEEKGGQPKHGHLCALTHVIQVGWAHAEPPPPSRTYLAQCATRDIYTRAPHTKQNPKPVGASHAECYIAQQLAGRHHSKVAAERRFPQCLTCSRTFGIDKPAR